MAIEQNTKLFFKYGPQAKYKALEAKDAGTFYVTSDTHRLYLGSDLLSQAVLVVETQKNLPSGEGIDVGQIAYVSAENILCIKKKETGWTQLNSDTYVESMTQVATSGQNQATVTTSLAKNHKNGGSEDPSASVVFKGSTKTGVNVTTDETGAVVISNANLAVQKDEATKGVKLSLGTANNVTFKGDGATKVDFSESAITITSTDNDTKVTGASLTNSANSTAGFILSGEINLSDNSHVEYTTTLDPRIAIGGTESKTIVPFKLSDGKGVASLDVYTKGEVDAAIKTAEKAMNAMTYKGKVSKTKPLPTAENSVSIGDAYIVEEKGFQIGGNGTAYPVGTLIIAKAADGVTENEKGFLPANGVVWDAVLTSDTDTTYTFGANTNAKQVFLNPSTEETSDGGLTFSTGTSPLTSTVSASGTNLSDITVSIEHNKKTAKNGTPVSVEQTTGADASLSYISNVTFDAYGHVDTITKGTAKIVDTKLSTLSFSAPTASGLMLTATDNKNGELSAGLTFKSTTLNISTSAVANGDATVTADIVWGTF